MAQGYQGAFLALCSHVGTATPPQTPEEEVMPGSRQSRIFADTYQQWQKGFLGRFESVKATMRAMTLEAADKGRQHPKATMAVACQLKCLEDAFCVLTKSPPSDQPDTGDFPPTDVIPPPRTRGGRAA